LFVAWTLGQIALAGFLRRAGSLVTGTRPAGLVVAGLLSALTAALFPSAALIAPGVALCASGLFAHAGRLRLLAGARLAAPGRRLLLAGALGILPAGRTAAVLVRLPRAGLSALARSLLFRLARAGLAGLGLASLLF
jgi:hypothetical protein